jgi:sterol desaturase/sphingolipid hydroxylase (fatty acid hydroxylase superfamily)
MNDIMFKEKINKYFSYQFIIYLILFGLSLILVKKDSPIILFISMMLLSVYVYFIHRLIHSIPKKYNLHIMLHHKSDLSIINWSIEVLINILFFVSFYMICLFFKIKFINPIIIFYFGFIYVTTHMINYSILHCDKTHRVHHKIIKENKTYNYGPDVFDHIFNTNYGNYFENNSHILINCIVGFFVTSALFKIPIFEK